MSALCFMSCPCEQMKVTKTFKDTCSPSRDSSASVQAVTSLVVSNQEVGHVSVWHCGKSRCSCIQADSPQTHFLFTIPDFYRGSGGCQVQPEYRLSGTGVTSKWRSEKSEIHTSSDRTKAMHSKTPIQSPPLGAVMGAADR